MTDEEMKQMKKLVAEHVAEKSKELSAKTGNKYISYFFRIISTVAATIGVYLLTQCTIETDHFRAEFYNHITEQK